MKKIKKYFSSFVFVMALIHVLPSNIFAQQSAIDWFNYGVSSKNPNDKINAYNKAIELDSSFIEAYYNLGIVYKNKGDLGAAEKILSEAYISHAYSMKNDLKYKLLYELGVTYKKLSRFKDAKETLLGATNIAPKGNIRSKIYYELGRVCLRLEEYDNAILYFNKGVVEAPSNEKYFNEAIKSVEKSKEAASLYGQALDMFNSNQFDKAARKFEQVLAVQPRFKDANARLIQSRNLSNQSKQNQEVEQLYRQAMAQFSAHDLEAASKSFQTVISLNPNYKDAREKLGQVQQAMDESTLEESLARQYTAGITAMKAKDWTKALVAFDRVQSINPNYRNVNRLIRDVQRSIDRQGIESAVSRYYSQGMMALANEDYKTALSAFNRVAAIEPNYRDVQKQISTVQDAMAKGSGQTDEAARYYLEGTEQIAKGEWLKALIAFGKVEAIDPNYKDTAQKMSLAKAALAKGEPVRVEQASTDSKNRYVVAGLILGFVLLPVVAVFSFSPTVRARGYLMTGNYKKALSIYEKLLARNPGRVKLYLLAAQAYLLENRTDEKAVKAFEMVLRLNLDTKQEDKQKITTIVAHHYMDEGRTDPEALQIMEKALNSEMNQK